MYDPPLPLPGAPAQPVAAPVAPPVDVQAEKVAPTTAPPRSESTPPPPEPVVRPSASAGTSTAEGRSLVEILRGLPQDKREEFLAACTPAELELIRTEVDNAPAGDSFKPLPHQVVPKPGKRGHLFTGGRGCVAPWTQLDLADGTRRPIAELAEEGCSVQLATPAGPRWTNGAPFLKGYANQWEVRTSHGAVITVTDQHRFLTPDGWLRLEQVRVGQRLVVSHPARPEAASSPRSASHAGGRRSTRTDEGSRSGCPTGRHSRDPRLRLAVAAVRGAAPSPAGAGGHSPSCSHRGAQACESECSQPCRRPPLRSKRSSCGASLSLPDGECLSAPSLVGRAQQTDRSADRSPRWSFPSPTVLAEDRGRTALAASLALPHAQSRSCTCAAARPLPSADGGSSCSPHLAECRSRPVSTLPGTPRQSLPGHQPYAVVTSIRYSHFGPFYDVTVPGPDSYYAEGLVHHNSGKSQGLNFEAVEHMQGPPCSNRVPGGHNVLAISPTASDAVAVFAHGPTSIRALWPGSRLATGAGGTHIVTPNGVWVKLTGAYTPDDVERFRASGNTCLVLADEVASYRREEVWDIMIPGLRLGKHPRWIAASTPKNRKLYKELLADENATHTHATIFDNPYIEQQVKDDLLKRLDGTRLGRQEIYGELIEDVDGALWTAELIETAKAGHPPELRRVVVGVDPSGSEGGDETGIVVAGIDLIDTVWILEDASTAGTAEHRFETICLAADRHNAGMIEHEAQFSGDNYSAGIKMTWARLAEQKKVPTICPKVKRTAARGSKSDRMLPVVALYEQGFVKHVPGLGGLENQQVTWAPDERWSPDRIDALVYAVRSLGARVGHSVRMVPRPTMTLTIAPSADGADPSGRAAADLAQRLGLYVPGSN